MCFYSGRDEFRVRSVTRMVRADRLSPTYRALTGGRLSQQFNRGNYPRILAAKRAIHLSPDVDAAVNSGAASPTCGEFCSCVLVIAET